MKTQYSAVTALSADQLSAFDSAVGQLKANTVGLVTLTPELKLQMRTMGPRSEAFCRRALGLMAQHPDLLAAKIPLEAALADLRAFDALRPRIDELTKLLARVIDTQFVLGSNIFVVALEGYNQLRRLGRAEGVKQACDDLSLLFSRSSAKAKARQAPPDGAPAA